MLLWKTIARAADESVPTRLMLLPDAMPDTSAVPLTYCTTDPPSARTEALLVWLTSTPAEALVRPRDTVFAAAVVAMPMSPPSAVSASSMPVAVTLGAAVAIWV